MWTLIFPIIALAYFSYDSTDYILNRSAGARIQKTMDAAVEKAAEKIKNENNIEQDAAANP